MKTENVTRFEVIDHRRPFTLKEVEANKKGRVYAVSGVEIEISLQDEGKTLKVFVGDSGKKCHSRILSGRKDK